MKRIAKDFYLKVTAIILYTAVIGYAGVLENLDNELTDLVEKAQPYLVTVEARNNDLDEVFIGSGVLVEKAGYVLTTTSVVENGNSIRVCFEGERSYKADIVGEDFHTGLALLKIDEIHKDVPTFADTGSLKDGSWIIVIGNSYEMSSAVNLGVYSGTTDDGFLQLSVQAGPGSSGSAILNTRGELIGILVAQATETVSLMMPDKAKLSHASGVSPKSSPSNLAMGLELPASGTSLAVPSSKITEVIDQLKRYGVVRHGYLGIRQGPLDPETNERLGLKTAALVVAVIEKSPAEKAGLKPGDVLVSVNDKTIGSPGHLSDLIRTHRPGDEIKLGVIRNESKITVRAVLAEARDQGYFNAQNFQVGEPANLYRDVKRFSDSLNNRISDAKDTFIEDQRVHNYIDKLEKKIVDLEGEVDGLTIKLDELYDKIKNK